jgi:hypothetical protein
MNIKSGIVKSSAVHPQFKSSSSENDLSKAVMAVVARK